MVRAFFNARATIWDIEVAEKDNSKLESMLSRMDIKTGSIILDIGTGTGIFVPFLLNKIGTSGRLIAIDIAEQMLTIARTKIFAHIIEHVQGDAVNLPFTDKSFNTVVCYSSFPHFHNKRQALAEISRVLKTSGRLYICHTASRSLINNIHSGMPEVKNDLLPENNDMYRMLSHAGFVKIEVEDKKDSYLATAVKY